MLTLLALPFMALLVPFGFFVGILLDPLLKGLTPGGDYLAYAANFLAGLPQMLIDLIGGLF